VSPEYTAVIECVPTLNEALEQVALPLVSVTAGHSVVLPSLNVTTPVGVRPNTFTVNITFWPNVDGSTDDPKLVQVVGLTTCDNVVEVEVALFASPEYTAVIECVPTLSDSYEQVALTLLSVTAEHSVELPSLNVTVPVGDWPVTTAVNVTIWSNAEGFADEITLVVVPAALTTCDNIVEVEPAPFASAEYTAVVEWCGSRAVASDPATDH